LNALEEAAGYEQLIAEFSYSQADLSKVIGKSRSHVANTLRLLKLPASVREKLAEGALSAGHARALLSVADPDAVARRVIAQGLTVRDVERLAQQEAQDPAAAAPARAAREKDPDTRALEQALEDVLGVGVVISHKPNGAGELRLRYGNLDQLDDLCRRLKN
jgi:ParB family chromosome partitioning protein